MLTWVIFMMKWSEMGVRVSLQVSLYIGMKWGLKWVIFGAEMDVGLKDEMEAEMGVFEYSNEMYKLLKTSIHNIKKLGF